MVAVDDNRARFVQAVFDDVMLIDPLDLPSIQPDERARRLTRTHVRAVGEDRRQVERTSASSSLVSWPEMGPNGLVQCSQCSVSVSMSRMCCSGRDSARRIRDRGRRPIRSSEAAGR